MKFVSEVQIQSSTFFFYSSWRPKQSQLEVLTFYLFIYLCGSLRHWSSLFFVAGWLAFGICLALVEQLRGLIQFCSGNILHYHLEMGKFKQTFLFYKVLVESFSTNLTWFLFPSMLQFLSFVIIYAVEWCLSVCSVSVLEKFLVESRKRLEIALILHYFALWLVQKTHATNQSDAKLKPITTWSPTFSRALVTLVVFNLNSRCLFKVVFLFSDWLSWLLNLCFITLSRKSLY